MSYFPKDYFSGSYFSLGYFTKLKNFVMTSAKKMMMFMSDFQFDLGVENIVSTV